MSMEIIKAPINKLIVLIILVSVFSLAIGTVNGWYLQAVDAGVSNGERFDRVFPVGTHKTADEAWATVLNVVPHGGTAAATVATSAYMVGNDTGACEITATTTASEKFYTPLGTVVTVAGTDGVIGSCEWKEETGIFGTGQLSTVIEIILQAAGLAGPILLLMEFGKFGNMFLNRTGMNPIISIIIMVVVFLVAGSLLNSFIPYAQIAFDAIDGDRFVMYDRGIGTLSTVASSFFGVVIVAGLLMVAWQLFMEKRTSGDALGRM